MTAKTRVEAHERRTHRALLAAWRNSLIVWAVLAVLLALSLGLAFVPLGAWNLPVGVGIAAVQVALVFVFFMDLRRANALTLMAVTAAFLFLLVMFGLTLNDLFTRF